MRPNSTSSSFDPSIYEFPEEDVSTRLIKLTINNKTIEADVHFADGFVLFEGDIIIATEDNFISQFDSEKGLIITRDRGERWPDGVMTYMVDPNLPNRERVFEAIAHFEENTRIRFVETTEANSNHVFFQRSSTGCSAHVGMVGNGRQYVNLHDRCSLGNTIHEICHSLGLWHEQSRADRDQYVNIIKDNIEEGKEHNFNIHDEDGIMRGRYDYRSITHYGRTSFGKETPEGKLVTIEVLDPSQPVIGQRNGLSESDINTLDFSYFPDGSTPCAPAPCGQGDSFQLNDVIHLLRGAPFSRDVSISSLKPLYAGNQILKVRKMTISPGARIEFPFSEEPNINDFYKALVIEELEVTETVETGHELFIGWYKSNLFDVLTGLKGLDQLERPLPTVGRGSHGLPGLPGGGGKTKHSPTVFVFIKKVTIINGSFEQFSFDIRLDGLPGGSGGRGGIGGNGNNGKGGRNARNGEFGSCRRGPGKGHSGGAPGRGGRGGDAGCGGNGSDLFLYFNDQGLFASIYNSNIYLQGAPPVIDEEGMFGLGGAPGSAGKEGIGGEGGSNAGNCGKRSSDSMRGRSGQPASNSSQWHRWHLGRGQHSGGGRDGVDSIEILDSYSRLVFEDPSSSKQA